MAKASIPPTLRSAVSERAQRRCEYCQRPDNQELNAYPHEVDHVTARKHGGQTIWKILPMPALTVTVTRKPISARLIHVPAKLSTSLILGLRNGKITFG